MKRCSPFSVVVLTLFLLLSCDHNWKYAIITNESDFTVVFKFKGVDNEVTLPKGESRRFDSYWTTLLEYYAPEKRVEYSSASDYSAFYGTFKTLPSWTLRVNNKFSGTVTLTADGWMEPMENISNGNANDSNHTGVIFTEKPSFEVITNTGFPAAAVYQVDGNIMYVTIE
jgi:hypothetical protein